MKNKESTIRRWRGNMSDMHMRSIDEANLETVIAQDVHFDGEMTLTNPILIKGNITGSITSGSSLFVGEHAHLKANIDAPVVSIRGRVTGKVYARKRLELFKTGTLKGEVHTSDLIIQSGSLFNGKCKMEKSSE